MSQLQEYNLDGLIGPTHFFGGLGVGNVASEQSAGNISYPKAAALQGLAKMKVLSDLGIPQLVMPPHPRPALHVLKEKGYSGSASEMISDVVAKEPALLPIIYSSSAMWTANAATVSASRDTKDGKLHLTPANLISNAHRRIEASFTAMLLKQIFHSDCFVHHDPLSDAENMKDEGAANHMHISPKASEQGFDIFVYGAGGTSEPKKYQARQHMDASKHIAAQHGLDGQRVLFLQQCPEAIDAGVFHNDVIATSNDHAIFYHEQAFVNETDLLAAADRVGGIELYRVEASELSLEEAVSTYLFNSQVVTKPDGHMVIIAPRQCEKSEAVQSVIGEWIKDTQCPITEAIYVDVDQSMANGGGPACLRLRVWMMPKEVNDVHEGVVFSDDLYQKLGNLIEGYYPEQISGDDLKNHEFPGKVLGVYPEIAQVLNMPDLYSGWI